MMRFENDLLLRLPQMDGPGKPAGIPQAAFGNPDGDDGMLRYVTGGSGRRLGTVVHLDDGEREFAYDRQPHAGKLDRGLNDAAGRGWHPIPMKNDWTRIFPAG